MPARGEIFIVSVARKVKKDLTPEADYETIEGMRVTEYHNYIRLYSWFTLGDIYLIT
jgi:hypothetical protein